MVFDGRLHCVLCGNSIKNHTVNLENQDGKTIGPLCYNCEKHLIKPCNFKDIKISVIS